MNNFQQEVITFSINGEPWFIGQNIANILGYSDASMAITVHVKERDKRFETLKISDSQNENLIKTVLINESGLYSLIENSKLSIAQQFKKWITSEFWPSFKRRIEEEEIQQSLALQVGDEYPKVQWCETFLDITKDLVNFRNTSCLRSVQEQVFRNTLKYDKQALCDSSGTSLSYAIQEKKDGLEVKKKVGCHNGEVREQTFLIP